MPKASSLYAVLSAVVAADVGISSSALSVRWEPYRLVSISRLLVAPKALLNLLTCYQRGKEGLHWVLSRVPPNIQALHNSQSWRRGAAKDVEAASTLPRALSSSWGLSAVAGHRPVGRLSSLLGSHTGKRIWWRPSSEKSKLPGAVLCSGPQAGFFENSLSKGPDNWDKLWGLSPLLGWMVFVKKWMRQPESYRVRLPRGLQSRDHVLWRWRSRSWQKYQQSSQSDYGFDFCFQHHRR